MASSDFSYRMMPVAIVRKIRVSIKFLSAILGPEMAAPILWTPGKMLPFCRKNHVHKIPRFRGGGDFGFWGGGECRFYFYGREDFSEIVSQNVSVLLFMGYRAIIAQCAAKWGIAQMCVCVCV